MRLGTCKPVCCPWYVRKVFGVCCLCDVRSVNKCRMPWKQSKPKRAKCGPKPLKKSFFIFIFSTGAFSDLELIISAHCCVWSSLRRRCSTCLASQWASLYVGGFRLRICLLGNLIFRVQSKAKRDKTALIISLGKYCIRLMAQKCLWGFDWLTGI